jgi:hypothetical protein
MKQNNDELPIIKSNVDLNQQFEINEDIAHFCSIERVAACTI